MKQIALVETARLTALAEFLDNDVPAQDFNLRAWILRTPKVRKTLLFGLIQTDPGCGFAGCAMGWAAYKGMFPGLAFDSGFRLVYNGTRNWAAVMTLMGINQNVAVFLFHPDKYKVKATPQMVASRIRRFVLRITAIRSRDQRRASKATPSLKVVA